MTGLVRKGGERRGRVAFPVGRNGLRLDTDVWVGIDGQCGGMRQVASLSGEGDTQETQTTHQKRDGVRISSNPVVTVSEGSQTGLQ